MKTYSKTPRSPIPYILGFQILFHFRFFSHLFLVPSVRFWFLVSGLFWFLILVLVPISGFRFLVLVVALG